MDKINKIKIKDVTYDIGGSATVDSGLSTTSENAVQNKVITSELGKKIDKSEAVKIARMTQAQYDALSQKDENTLYIIITES